MLELATAAGLVLGVVSGVQIGANEVQTRWQSEAYAATAVPQKEPWIPVSPIEPQMPIPERAESPGPRFDGVEDDVLLAPLRGSPVRAVKFNRGGSSVSLRIEFENGARAAFKPRQTNPQTVPRREVAAFRFNRILGLRTVPPAIGGKFDAREIYRKMVQRSRHLIPRLRNEIIVRRGWMVGELSWWIPVIHKARIQGFRIDSTNGIVTWKRYLRVGTEIPEKSRRIVSQISDLVLFDFVINNPDRWSGGNARISEDGKTLYFMDNTMSFGDNPRGHRKVGIYLRRSQKFSRSLVRRIAGLTREQVATAMSGDIEPFDYLLSEREIDALLARRDAALAYINELSTKHGADQVLVFP